MTSIVLMKALPPTQGHERLIDFAQWFTSKGVVLIDTAPGEPYVAERLRWAEAKTCFSDWRVKHLDIDDQDPESDGFWDRWKGYIAEAVDGSQVEFVIGSEPYCAKVAEAIGAQYIPYDPGRQLVHARGTDVRQALYTRFIDIADSFKADMRVTVTIFGAESTGKTTLSRDLHKMLDSEWIFEWARPYLEYSNKTVVDLADMHNIWHGQSAVELNAMMHTDKPFIFRDTDLWSTIGYWEQPHWVEKLGAVPKGLIEEAKVHMADLYLFTQSNIPFEKDPLRYGGDHRESPDSYWREFAQKYSLPVMELTERTRDARLDIARAASLNAFFLKNLKLTEVVRV